MLNSNTFRIPLLLLGLLITTFLLYQCKQEELLVYNFKYSDTVTDVDGNKYKTIKIGNDQWFAENLKTTHYYDNKPITDLYSYNNNIENVKEYGYLYTPKAAIGDTNYAEPGSVKIQGACPTGWHLPTFNDWTNLTQEIKDGKITQLKEEATEHWMYPNFEGDNSYGFSALPGGARTPEGTFGGIKMTGMYANFNKSTDWGTTSFNYVDINYVTLYYKEGESDLNFYGNNTYYLNNQYIEEINYPATSLRCVRNKEEIVFLSPQFNETVIKGKELEIKWKSNFVGALKIELINSTSSRIITGSTTESSYKWTIPTDIQNGNNYSLKITSLADTSLKFYSGQFEILDKMKIGIHTGGGIVFWVDETGENGLIVALEDAESGNSVDWGCNQIKFYGASSETNGYENTQKLFAACPTSYNAATICYNYANNGYDDWYLPSKLELKQLILVNDSLPQKLQYRYWSSTEVDSANAWFGNSEFSFGFESKSYGGKVRPIRRFGNGASNLKDISLIYPKENYIKIARGIEFTIKWKSNAGDNVKIELFSNFGKQADIVASTPNTGSYKYTFPNSTPILDNYYIIIRNVENASVYDRSGYFNLTEGLTTGMKYQGGIIGYVDNSGKHGLIVSETNLNTTPIEWGCSTTAITSGNGAEDENDGIANTLAIITDCSGTNPARLCADYELDGYADWYLPSRNELSLIYQTQAMNIGMYSDYWSSTESSKDQACSLDFSWGTQSCVEYKYYTLNVRAIRKF